MRQRAPYRDDVFDDEDFTIFGIISAVDTLAGATLEFIGWDENGAVIWSTATPTGIAAAVSIVDAAAKRYSATVGKLPADTSTTPAGNKVYSWQVRRTNAGQGAALVWGFVTVTPSAYANND